MRLASLAKEVTLGTGELADLLCGRFLDPETVARRMAVEEVVATLRARLLPLSSGAPGVFGDLEGRALEPGMVLEALHLLAESGTAYPVNILLDLAYSAAEAIKYAPDDVDAAVRVAVGALTHRLGGDSLDVVVGLTRALHADWGT
jgi:hypothetical protein